jgi:hypothetical protein
MLERREEARLRVFLGGVIAFNGRSSTIDCHVRNITSTGAFIALESTAMIPDEFDFAVPARGRSLRARMIWRTDCAAGLSFINSAESRVIPLDYAVKLKACERENVALKRRVADLSS